MIRKENLSEENREKMLGENRNFWSTNMQIEKGDHVNVIRTANGAARCVRRAAPERGGRADLS